MRNDTIYSKDESKNYYILVAGLPLITEPLQLAPGITIRPLSCDLTVFDLAAAGAVGFREWAVLEPIIHDCVNEIETAADSATTPGYDALNRAWLASVLLSLQGFKSLCVACNTYSWDLIAGRVNSPKKVARYPSSDKLPMFNGGLLDFYLEMWGWKEPRMLTKIEANFVYEKFNMFNQLAAQSDKFRLALESSVDWKFFKDPRSAIARIWCGIEAICGISNELVYRISLMCASLLEERGEKRLKCFHVTKKLYNFRSKAVHGDELSKDQMLETMFSSSRLLRDLIILTGKKGHVLSDKDFNEAIFY